MSQEPSWAHAWSTRLVTSGMLVTSCFDENGLAAGAGDLVSGALGFFGVVYVVDYAVGAFLGETFCDGLADAGAGTCDDSDFSFEACEQGGSWGLYVVSSTL
jgi:hypothetical protein